MREQLVIELTRTSEKNYSVFSTTGVRLLIALLESNLKCIEKLCVAEMNFVNFSGRRTG